MTLSSLVSRNILRNFKEYMLYFLSMIFSIVMYFTFTALQYNTQLKAIMNDSEIINGSFQVSKVMLIIFITVFIIYSNGFFVRKRQKEIGLYSLLGISKRRIGTMLFCETMIMGTIALIMGILAGIISSKLFLELLMTAMKLDITIFFEIPRNAILDTSIIFLVIFLYTSLKSFRLVYRFKLIEFFQADRKEESIPKGSIRMAFIAFLLIGSGYMLVIKFFSVAKYIGVMTIAFYILLATVLGTYLLFTSYTAVVLKRARNSRSTFYNGMNIIIISQLLYRVRGQATSLATIAVLSAATLTAVGTAVTTYYNGMKTVRAVAPYSFSYEKKDETFEKRIHEVFEEEKKTHSITEQYNIEMIPVRGEFKGEKDNTLLNYQNGLNKEYQLISQSTFNGISRKLEVPTINLTSKEAYVVDGEDVVGYKGNQVMLLVGEEKKTLVIRGAMERNLTNLRELVVVVSDQVYEVAKKNKEVRIVKNINIKEEKNSKELAEKLSRILPPVERGAAPKFATFYKVFEDFKLTDGIMLFIGSFLGLVFLLATGSIIYFKQLAEAYSSKRHYEVLRKIGATKRSIYKSISKQISFIFVMPVIVGIVHSLFALKLVMNAPIQDMIVPVLISSGAYCLIYFGYYILTVHSYFKIVYNKN